MIFLIIPKGNRRKGREAILKDFLAASLEKPISYKAAAHQVIAWSEAFKDFAELRECLLTAAGGDAVCQEIRNSAMVEYGIDPFLVSTPKDGVDRDTVAALFDTTLFYWAHPSIGNITLSPEPRPGPSAEEPLANWKSCDILDADTKEAIQQLHRDLKAMDRSRRDQVRICGSMTELARAFIGEIACAASKRLEKLFALALTQSAELLKTQRGLLQHALETGRNQWVKELEGGRKGKKTLFEAAEYTRYYLGDTRPPKGRDWPWLATLLNDALDTVFFEVSIEQGPPTELLADWRRLPPTIRCAILMNDLRKLGPFAKNPDKTSMCFVVSDKPAAEPSKRSYEVADSAPLFPSNFHATQWRFAWSWNRDEFARPTITYRQTLCPLWAGASGHTGGNLAFWKEVGGTKFSSDAGFAVAAGLFTLWRLYYDRRLSCNHTLAETFESTTYLVDPMPTAQWPVHDTIEPEERDDWTDAFNIVRWCSRKRGGFIDPILLFTALRSHLRVKGTQAQQFQRLQEDIDGERERLDKAGFMVPVWSHEIRPRTGLRVLSFAQRRSGVDPVAGPTGLTTSPRDTSAALDLLRQGEKDKDDEDKDK